jgi:large subunit ribosomal protein L5
VSLVTTYRQKVIPAVQKELKISNVLAVPRIEKIVLNIGIGSYVQKKDKNYAPLVDRVAAISGQKPVVALSSKSISNFKLRAGMPTGIKVTLRGKRMLHFIDRLVGIALPRIRDFRGVSKKAFDKGGNYSIGLSEITAFSEVRVDDISKLHGMQINIVTTATNTNDSFVLLKALGFPFKK